MEEKTKTTNDKEVWITRTLDAPRELVFKAWTDPVMLAKWYAPEGCEIKIYNVDLRPGGLFHHCISAPGFDCICRGVYEEIVPPEKIVYRLGFSDKDGNLLHEVPFEHHKDWPIETTVTVLFEEKDGKTTITLHQTVSEALAKETGAYPSWLSMLDKMELLLK